MEKKNVFARAIRALLVPGVMAASLSIQAPVANVVSAASCVVPPANVVSWWPGDGNANDIADGNPGILQNGATFAAGQVGQAFSLDGVDDKVFIGNPANLRLQDFTIDAWIKLNTLTINGFAERIAGYGIGGYGFFLAGPGVVNANGATAVRQLSLDKPGFDMVAAPLAVNDLGWHHVAVTKSGGTVTFYLDGVSAGARRGGAPIASYNPGFAFNTNFTLGNFDTQVQPFPGLMDEVGVFNRALSSSEILSIFNAGSAGMCKVPADITPPPPAFSQPMSSIFPNAPFLTCLQGHFESNDADRHYWFVKPKASGPLTIDARAVSVNPAETGSINANLFDGPTLLGAVTVNHPTGTFPGDQNIGYITFNADSSKIYRLEVQRGMPAPNTQQAHHYKLSMTGVEADLGINSPSYRYLEHNGPREVFQVNVNQDENFSLKIATESPDFGANQASTVTLQIRERSSGAVLYPTQTQPVSLGNPLVLAIPNMNAGSLVISISANGHYRMDKLTGTDHGIYFETCPPGPVADSQSVFTPEGTPINIQLTGSSGVGDSLTFSIINQPTQGTITSFDPSTGMLTYTPTDPEFNGPDFFSFIVNDGFADSAQAVVSISVTAVNDPPTADAGADQTVDEDTPVSLSGTGNDIDIPAQTLTFSWTQTAGPTVALTGANTQTPSFIAPLVAADTILTFELTVSDGLASAKDSVNVTVKNVQVAGVATRTQGFWSTHFEFAQQTWLNIHSSDRVLGSKNMGDGSNDISEMMGGFWSHVSKKTDGSARTALDQARMQLTQQLLAAMLNRQAFNTDDAGAIAAGKAAFAGNNINTILNAKSSAEAYNLSGDSQPLPVGVNQGSASPKTGQSQANKIFWNVLP